MKYTSHIVIGLRWGDEGKGKIINMIAEEISNTKNVKRYFCVRYNGGPNAGHTIYHKGHKVVTHQIPSGILYGMPSIIGDNCYLDIPKLIEEIKMLNKLGINLQKIDDKFHKSLLYISPRAHIITDNHRNVDGKDIRIGTTKSGIGPCAMDKYSRNGFRLGDDGQNKLRDELLELGVYIEEPSQLLMTFYEKFGYHAPCLVEGAQGWGLDITHGWYPYVTSSHCIASDCFNMGINMQPCDINGNEYEVRIWGVAKAYETYVGAMEFQPTDDPWLNRIQEVGHEYGSTTGRPRQCNYLDLNSLYRAAFINQCTDIVINKCDVLDVVSRYATREIYPPKSESVELTDTNPQNAVLGHITDYSNWDEFKSAISSKLYDLPALKTPICFEFSPSEPSNELINAIEGY